MKNLLRILVLLIIVAAVTVASMFLINQNKNYSQNDSVPPVVQSGEELSTENFENEKEDEEVIESGENLEISGDLVEEIDEIVESGEVIETEEIKVIESGEILQQVESLESGEIASGELAE